MRILRIVVVALPLAVPAWGLHTAAAQDLPGHGARDAHQALERARYWRPSQRDACGTGGQIPMGAPVPQRRVALRSESGTDRGAGPGAGQGAGPGAGQRGGTGAVNGAAERNRLRDGSGGGGGYGRGGGSGASGSGADSGGYGGWGGYSSGGGQGRRAGGGGGRGGRGR
jgi:hypothetical protein